MAVIDLAEAPAPLTASPTDVFLLFIGHGAFVENKAAIRGASEKKIGLQDHPIHYEMVLPGRMRREMLQ